MSLLAQSGKMAASLVRLIPLRLQLPDLVSGQATAKVTSLLNKDVDSSREIAERWLTVKDAASRSAAFAAGVKSNYTS